MSQSPIVHVILRAVPRVTLCPGERLSPSYVNINIVIVK